MVAGAPWPHDRCRALNRAALAQITYFRDILDGFARRLLQGPIVGFAVCERQSMYVCAARAVSYFVQSIITCIDHRHQYHLVCPLTDIYDVTARA